MLDILDWVLIGGTAANTVANVVEGVTLSKHGKQLKELEGSAGTAAAAYNAAKDAEMNAAKANQHCDWLHAELDKQKILPEKPKSEGEIMSEFMKNFTQYIKASTPEVPKQPDPQSKLIADAVAVGVAEAMKNFNSGK